MCPIKGLTDNVKPSFPSLGKLRKGAKRTEEDIAKKQPGKDLPGYFRFTSENIKIETEFYSRYGAEPDHLNVFLPQKSVEGNWEAWQEHWVAGGLKHRCDGETCVVWQDDSGEYRTDPKPCPGECKEVGRLQLILPELLLAGYVGYVTLETHSLHDIRSLQACLDDAYGRSNGHGLQGIEFLLYRVKETISTPTPEGKRVRRKSWLVKLTPSARWVQAQIAAATAEGLALPAPSEEPEVTEETEGDFEDGEYEEWEKPVELPEEQDEAAGDLGWTDLELTKQQLLKTLDTNTNPKRNGPATPAQKGTVVMVIGQATGLEKEALDQARHLVLEWLWGKQHVSELTFGEAWVTLNWLIDKGNSKQGVKIVVDAKAAEEVKKIMRLRQVEQGQLELGG